VTDYDFIAKGDPVVVAGTKYRVKLIDTEGAFGPPGAIYLRQHFEPHREVTIPYEETASLTYDKRAGVWRLPDVEDSEPLAGVPDLHPWRVYEAADKPSIQVPACGPEPERVTVKKPTLFGDVVETFCTEGELNGWRRKPQGRLF
jgi:hypothetical protein